MSTVTETQQTVFAGTVISGTLRPQDLIPAFLDALRELAPEAYAQLQMQPFSLPPAYAQEDDDADWWASDACHDFVHELHDALDEHAPEGYVFGTHEGDGCDFGFWEAAA